MRQVLTEPLTLEQRARAMSTTGTLKGVMAVSLATLLTSGHGGIRRVLATRLAGHEDLRGLEYRVVGHLDDDILLEVTAADPTVALHAR